MDHRSLQLCDEAEAARNAVLALATGLNAEQLDRPTPNDGWSVKDTLAHLSSIEARVRLMVRTVLDGGTWTADRADLDAYNARCVEERRSWGPEAVLTELRETGRATADLLGGLTADQLDCAWDHPIFGR